PAVIASFLTRLYNRCLMETLSGEVPPAQCGARQHERGRHLPRQGSPCPGEGRLGHIAAFHRRTTLLHRRPHCRRRLEGPAAAWRADRLPSPLPPRPDPTDRDGSDTRMHCCGPSSIKPLRESCKFLWQTRFKGG